MNKQLKICLLQTTNNKHSHAIAKKLKMKNMLVDIKTTPTDYINDKYYDAIIPIGVKASQYSVKYDNSLYDNSELVKHLNDKVKVQTYTIDEIIPQIPTLNLKHVTDEQIKNFVNDNTNFKRFIYKPKNLQGGFGQKIFNRDNIKLHKDDKRKGILQPYFETVLIYATELVAQKR